MAGQAENNIVKQFYLRGDAEKLAATIESQTGMQVRIGTFSGKHHIYRQTQHGRRVLCEDMKWRHFNKCCFLSLIERERDRKQ